MTKTQLANNNITAYPVGCETYGVICSLSPTSKQEVLRTFC